VLAFLGLLVQFAAKDAPHKTTLSALRARLRPMTGTCWP